MIEPGQVWELSVLVTRKGETALVLVLSPTIGVREMARVRCLTLATDFAANTRTTFAGEVDEWPLYWFDTNRSLSRRIA